jgi:hypothetical protein
LLLVDTHPRSHLMWGYGPFFYDALMQHSCGSSRELSDA